MFCRIIDSCIPPPLDPMLLVSSTLAYIPSNENMLSAYMSGSTVYVKYDAIDTTIIDHVMDDVYNLRPDIKALHKMYDNIKTIIISGLTVNNPRIVSENNKMLAVESLDFIKDKADKLSRKAERTSLCGINENTKNDG